MFLTLQTSIFILVPLFTKLLLSTRKCFNQKCESGSGGIGFTWKIAGSSEHGRAELLEVFEPDDASSIMTAVRQYVTHIMTRITVGRKLGERKLNSLSSLSLGTS